MIDLASMSDEEYFGQMKLLFSSDPWKLLVASFEAERASVDTIDDVKDNEQLWYRKGQLRVLNNLLNLENMVLIAEAQSTPETRH